MTGCFSSVTYEQLLLLRSLGLCEQLKLWECHPLAMGISGKMRMHRDRTSAMTYRRASSRQRFCSAVRQRSG